MIIKILFDIMIVNYKKLRISILEILRLNQAIL